MKNALFFFTVYVPSSIAESQKVIILEFSKDLPSQITVFLKMTICILYLSLMESFYCYLQYQNYVVFNVLLVFLLSLIQLPSWKNVTILGYFIVMLINQSLQMNKPLFPEKSLFFITSF